MCILINAVLMGTAFLLRSWFMASVDEQARYRVTNPTERPLGWHYDSVRYVVEPQSSVVLSDVVAQHLKKYHDVLELTPVEAVYQDAGSPAPAVYSCPSAGCGFSCNEFPANHAHIAEHMAPRAAEPAAKAEPAKEKAEVPSV